MPINKIIALVFLIIIFLIFLFFLYISLLIFINNEREKDEKKVEGLKQKIERLKIQQEKTKEKNLMALEKQFELEKRNYEKMVKSLNAIKNQQLKLIPKLESYKKKLEEKIDDY